MPALFDVRWIGEHGIGRFARELDARLGMAPHNPGGAPMSPLDPFKLGMFGLRAAAGDWLLSPGYNGPIVSRMPFIFTIHDLNHIDRPENSGLDKRLYYRTVLRRLTRRARAILTVSDFSRDRIADWFELDRSVVFNVGNGVSEVFSPFGSRHDAGTDYVLCVSNRRGHKNEPTLLRSFALARLPATVALILTGEPTPELVSLAASLGIAERLRFTGRVSEDNLAALYRGALFLVFPSLYEGFGLPIVEAFACGTPVITSNVTSMPEIAADAALTVDPLNERSIAFAMDELYASPALRDDLAARGRRRAALYTWDAVAQRVLAAIRTVGIEPNHSAGSILQ
jgi:glycosyltransferase involved in cell wall biosynthesis